MTRYVDDGGVVAEEGKSELDGDATSFFLRGAIGILARQPFYKQRLAVVDVTRSTYDRVCHIVVLLYYFPVMAEVIRIDPERLKARHVARIVEVLRGGGVVIYPTDTVYGFGCEFAQKGAIERIRRLKGRDAKKPMSFVCADLTNISRYSRVSNFSYRLLKRFLPGPYTFVLPATKETPRLVQSKRKTVGIRIPDHPCRWLSSPRSAARSSARAPTAAMRKRSPIRSCSIRSSDTLSTSSSIADCFRFNRRRSSPY